MRGRIGLIAGVVLLALNTGASADSSPSVTSCLRAIPADCGPGRVVVDVDAEVIPRALPKRAAAPITVGVDATITTNDGSRPPTLREAVVALDRNLEIDPTGFPVCHQLRGEHRNVRTDLRTTCADSIVGRGTAAISFTSGPPSARTPLTFFNGGVIDRTVRLAVQIEVAAPILTEVTVKRVQEGRFGYSATWKAAPILAGSASLSGFDFKFKRGYVRARCTNNTLQSRTVKAVFRQENDAASPPTVLTGKTISPCTASRPTRPLK